MICRRHYPILIIVPDPPRREENDEKKEELPKKPEVIAEKADAKDEDDDEDPAKHDAHMGKGDPDKAEKKEEKKDEKGWAGRRSCCSNRTRRRPRRGSPEDVLNDENAEAQQPAERPPNDAHGDLFVFPDEQQDADLYDLDFSRSHPFENECRYPLPKRDEDDLLKNVRHYRRVHCGSLNNSTIPMVSQLPSGEILIGVPHRAKFRSGIKCRGRELSGTLRKDKRKLLEIGDWFEIPQDRRVFINKDQFVVECTEASGKVLLTDVFTSLSEKPRLKPAIVDKEDRYNIELSSGHMPLTLKFMRKMDFKFLSGHTKLLHG
ncbi:hypothetical protein M3Y99_00550900 [Aphelenchoides fujianensis]|nr:hypothetical protein M3Y99_00550900 [Aphelenchoides fujianensis]